jgi:malate dehydrogenase
VVPDVPFFASKVLLGPEGVAQVLGLGQLNDAERAGLDAMLPELKASITKGVKFVLEPAPAKA